MNAEHHLTVAEGYLSQALDDIPSEPHLAVNHVGKFTSLASDHIDKARAIDPKARIYARDKWYTIDDLKAEALRLQGHVEARHGPTKRIVKRGIAASMIALKYRPHSPAIHLSIAVGNMRIRRKREARRWLDKAIELDPTDQYAHQLRDGARGPDEVGSSIWRIIRHEIRWNIGWVAGFIFIVIIPAYGCYKVYRALEYGEPDGGYYLLWVFGPSAIGIGFAWLKEKWDSM